MGDGHPVARVQDHRQGVLGGGEGVEDALLFQPDEIIGVALQHGGADLGHGAGGRGLGQLLGLGDPLVGQHPNIFLLALGDGAAGGHNVIPGHVDHGVALDQIGGVLEGDEIGGLIGDVQQDGEGGGVPQILDHAFRGGLGGPLGGAGGVVEPGLLGALVGQQETQVGLVGVGGGDAGVHIHIVIQGDIIVALGGDGHVPLAQHGVDEAVDEGAVVVVLLHDQLRGVHIIHPGGYLLIVLALAGDGVAQYSALDVGAAEQADGLDDPGGDPPGLALLIDLKLGGGEHEGGVLEAQMPLDVPVERLGEGVLHPLAQPHHLGLLGDHIHHHIGGQALGAVGEPFDEVAIGKAGDPHRAALIVDLGVGGQNFKLGHHIRQLAQLTAAETGGGILVNYRNLGHVKLSYVLGKIAILNGNQIPVTGGVEKLESQKRSDSHENNDQADSDKAVF